MKVTILLLAIYEMAESYPVETRRRQGYPYNRMARDGDGEESKPNKCAYPSDQGTLHEASFRVHRVLVFIQINKMSNLVAQFEESIWHDGVVPAGWMQIGHNNMTRTDNRDEFG